METANINLIVIKRMVEEKKKKKLWHRWLGDRKGISPMNLGQPIALLLCPKCFTHVSPQLPGSCELVRDLLQTC